MNKVFGFIGTGNMGGALARAASKVVASDNMLLSDSYSPVAETLAQELGCKAVTVTTVAVSADFIWLGVKPQVMESLLKDIGPYLASRTEPFVLVSMAAGLSIKDIRRMAGADYPVIRIMPNIPVKAGSGLILYDVSENVGQDALDAFRWSMTYAGLVDRIPEHLIDAGSALSGCGPAFVSLFVEALADGAVACGLPRGQAVLYAEQTLMGTAKYLIESGVHPGALKDAVCSPGGSTIAGVLALESGAFRASAADAVVSAYEKTLELGK